MSERAARPFHKCSLGELLELGELPLGERLGYLEEVLQVGLSKVVFLLQDLPLGFGSVGPIKEVIREYVQDFRDLEANPSKNPTAFLKCIEVIFARHRGLVTQIANGLNEFQRELGADFQPHGSFESPRCANLGDAVPAVRRIEQALDDFFTARTTLRLLISHCAHLGPRGHRAEICDVGGKSRVGTICLDTRPSQILVHTYEQALAACDFGLAERVAPLLVNGMPAQDYLAESRHHQAPGLRYVDNHLEFVFYELMKNALDTSCRRAIQDGGVERPIEVTILEGTSLGENERTVKISDCGEGLSRDDLKKVWSYFYSTSNLELGNWSSVGDDLYTGLGSLNEELRLHNSLNTRRGLGLPISRVLMRYWGGDIELHSIPRRGTDVYVYL